MMAELQFSGFATIIINIYEKLLHTITLDN